jgi:hypothetical protein
MRTHLISRAEILDAISRVHDFDTYPPIDPAPQDGTYRIIPTWVGSSRVWMAQAIREDSGYEIGYASVMDGEFWYPLDEIRFGYWRDPETGVEYLDETVHVKGNYLVALNMGAYYSQIAIWDWHAMETIDVAGNVVDNRGGN